MPKTAQAVYDEIVSHINKQGGPKSSWYAGITDDLDRRVHQEHKVPRENHWLITRQCNSDEESRAVENALLELGCDGGWGGGTDDSVYVYAYLKNSVTDP